MQKMHIANMDNKELAMEYIIRKATFDDLEELRGLYLVRRRWSQISAGAFCDWRKNR